MSFWIDDFWKSSFWVDDFWLGLTATTPTPATPSTIEGGGGAKGWTRQAKSNEEEELIEIINIAIPEIMKYLK